MVYLGILFVTHYSVFNESALAKQHQNGCAQRYVNTDKQQPRSLVSLVPVVLNTGQCRTMHVYKGACAGFEKGLTTLALPQTPLH